jgi:hypothetical protein
MSFKNTPITAKIKRTTKGGITQPLLNVGAPVKMKMSSPAKIDPNTEAADFKSKYDAREKAKADKAAQALIAKKASDLSSYKKSLTQYRKDILNSDNAAKTPDGPGFGANALRARIMKGVSDKKAEAKRILDFENNLYNYDKKHKAGSTDGYTAKEYALAKASDTYKSRATPAETPTPTTTPTTGTGTKKSYDQAYKDSRNVKEYAGMSKAEYIKEAKRQTASKKSGKGWDAKRSKKEAVKPVKGAGIKGAGTKTVKTKAKATSTSKKEITSKNNSSSFINNKRTADIVKGKVNAKPAKEVESKKVKKSTKVKYDPSTGTGGSVAGNLIRSITGSRKRDRAKAAERKAKGQASKAVGTDSKVDFKQFIGKTKETPAKKKKSAAKKKK